MLRSCHGTRNFSHASKPRRPWFDPGPVHVKFMTAKVAPGQVFLQVLPFSSVSIIETTFHTLHLNNNRTNSTNGRNLGTLKKSGGIPSVGQQETETYFHIVSKTSNAIRVFSLTLSSGILIYR